jgi:hypothetical protein
MGWLYDFNMLKVLSDKEFEQLANIADSEADSSGIGFRVFASIYGDCAPLVLSDIKSVVFCKNMQNGLPNYISENGIEAYRKTFGALERLFLGSIADECIASFECLDDTSNEADLAPNLVNPRDAIGLHSGQKGKGIKICIIDTEFGFTQDQVTSFGEAYLNISSDDQIKAGHGAKVNALIASSHSSIAPQAKMLFVNITKPWLASIVIGILWASKQRCDIVNLSVYANQYRDNIPEILKRAIDYCSKQNCTIVASAAASFSDPGSALALSQKVIAVGGKTPNGSILYRGPNNGIQPWRIDCISLGKSVKADLGNGNIVAFDGASAAAALVSGALAIVKSESRISSSTALRRYFFKGFCIPHSNGPLWGNGEVSLKNIKST